MERSESEKRNAKELAKKKGKSESKKKLKLQINVSKDLPPIEKDKIIFVKKEQPREDDLSLMRLRSYSETGVGGLPSIKLARDSSKKEFRNLMILKKIQAN